MLRAAARRLSGAAASTAQPRGGWRQQQQGAGVTTSLLSGRCAPLSHVRCFGSEVPRFHARRVPRAAVAAAATVAGAGIILAANPTHADYAAKVAVGSLPYDRAQRVMDWLGDKGAAFIAVEVRPVDPGSAGHVEEHGMGLYVKDPAPRDGDGDGAGAGGGDRYDKTVRGGGGGGGDAGGASKVPLPPVAPVHKVGLTGFISSLFGGGHPPVVVASVPLRLAITVATAADHPALGATFREMLADGDLDERMAIMLLLIVERRRGRANSHTVALHSETKPGLHPQGSSTVHCTLLQCITTRQYTTV